MHTTARAERVSHLSVQGYIARAATVPEGWPSGLRRTLGKRVYGKPYRGFESHSLRQLNVRHRPSTSKKSLNYMDVSRILRLRTCRHVCHNRRINRWCGRWSTVRFRRAQMGRTLHRLSPTKVRTAKDTGMYADGGGLYLQVKAGADGRINKSWLFRYAIPETAISANGNERQKERQMGLGSLDTISLAEAREAAVHCRKLRVQGIDPIAAREAE